MKRIYLKAIGFWFILLVIALINATIRETTYKPYLTPVIGKWAHQISSITGIMLFYAAIYFFVKKNQGRYFKRDLLYTGITWLIMTVIFESMMNIYVRHLSFSQVMETYYFWKGDTWLFVLLSLVVSPIIADRRLKAKTYEIN